MSPVRRLRESPSGWYITSVPPTSGEPARHRRSSRTPGPLDSLPRPLSERERRAGGPWRRLRPPLAVLVAGPIPAPIASLTGYQWPLPHGRVTLPFGPSRLGSRLVEGKAFHDGLDIATFCGDRVVAAHAGTVLAAGRHYDGQMGWVGSLKAYTARLDKKHLWATLPIVVVIDDGNGYRSMYAHFHRLVVKKGQTVKAGQLLGYEGMTGRATGCHLHYG